MLPSRNKDIINHFRIHNSCVKELLYPQYTECIHTGHFDRVLTQRGLRCYMFY